MPITKLNTPVTVEVLLHCYVSPNLHPRHDAPSVRQAFKDLSEAGLIAPDDKKPLSGIYHTTDRGDAHVHQLCNLALPSQAWVGANGKLIDKPIC